MGLFDKMFSTQNQSETTLTPAEAFAAITLAAIASDGYLSDEEVEGFMSTLNRMQLFRSYPKDVMQRMIDRLFGILQRDGVATLFHSAKSALPYELQESAFAVATDLILSDGVVTDQEKQFLNDLYVSLEIPDELATKIVEVMMIKNRG